MKRLTRVLRTTFLLGVTVLLASTAEGQTSAPTGQSGGAANESRKATGTAVGGDTGLWSVPTATVLPLRRWTISFARINQQDGQGFTNVSNFPLAFGFGLSSRVEVFGSWTLLTRIDRDTIPTFFESAASAASSGTGGGLTADYPYDRKTWIKDGHGDLRLGGKFNLVSQDNGSAASFAIRAAVKLGVGSQTKGASTKQTDGQIDAIVSKSLESADVTGFAGMLIRGNPIGYNLTNGLRWGFGVGVPLGESRALTFGTELYGEHYFNKTITAPAAMTAPDGSVVPTSTTLKDPVYLGLSLTWRAANGFFIGGAFEWNMTVPSRDQAVPLGSTSGFPNSAGGSKGYEIRLGYRLGGAAASKPAVSRPAPGGPGAAPAAGAPGARPGGAAGGAATGAGAAGAATGAAAAGAAGAGAAGAAPPPGGAAGAAAAAAAAAPRANRPPTLRVSCDPCTVEAGRTSTVSADAQDPDGDPLTYQWTGSSGTFANTRSRQTSWTAPLVPGPVRVTVSVDDGHGGVMSSGVTIEVVAAGVRNLTFEEVHFDFDKSVLRPDAIRILDDMITKLKANPSVKVEIEGHTCDIGTKEYNLALGQRRAQRVLDYLVAHGISRDRLHTTSFGEERPKYDNAREETKKLNRRAEFVVRIQ